MDRNGGKITEASEEKSQINIDHYQLNNGRVQN
jgi:hypothetical protein